MKNNINWSNYGHTFEDHIEPDDNDLKMRLILGKYDCGTYDGNAISIASRFVSENIAKKVIDYTLEKKKDDIATWLKEACVEKTVFYINFMKPIGYGYVKNTNWDNPYPLYKLCIVLQADCHFRNYEIVTCYPVPNNAVKAQIIKDRKNFLSRKLKK